MMAKGRAPLRFGIFDHLERGAGPLDVLYEERLAMLEFADQAGLWGYHKAEHHFIDLDLAPSSNVFLAAASQRTRNLRFGPLVYLLPFYHPLRLIEEICVLDNLCQGRLEIGVGKGISPVEHRLWGSEPDVAKACFEETLEVVRQGLIEQRIDFHGDYHRFDDVAVNLRPYQGRVPGLWYAGNAEYAGRHRMSTVLSGPVERLAEQAQVYRGLVAAASREFNPGVDVPVFTIKRHVYVAKSDAEARERVARAYPVYHRNLAELWKRHDVPFPTIDPSFGGDMDAAIAAGDLVIGSAASVRAQIAPLVERVGADYVIGAFAWGDLTHEEYMDSLVRFTQEVACEFG